MFSLPVPHNPLPSLPPPLVLSTCFVLNLCTLVHGGTYVYPHMHVPAAQSLRYPGCYFGDKLSLALRRALPWPCFIVSIGSHALLGCFGVSIQ
ncbi:hypothetical protein F5X98DRAFT_341858 [Xylaria grammica]|nr:hypothetical protein F5X98DRAFT_341858 [Xylaria grammica]